MLVKLVAGLNYFVNSNLLLDTVVNPKYFQKHFIV